MASNRGSRKVGKGDGRSSRIINSKVKSAVGSIVSMKTSRRKAAGTRNNSTRVTKKSTVTANDNLSPKKVVKTPRISKAKKADKSTAKKMTKNKRKAPTKKQ